MRHEKKVRGPIGTYGKEKGSYYKRRPLKGGSKELDLKRKEWKGGGGGARLRGKRKKVASRV